MSFQEGQGPEGAVMPCMDSYDLSVSLLSSNYIMLS
jgi:hypothetical protein